MTITNFTAPAGTTTVYVAIASLDEADGTVSTDSASSATFAVTPDTLGSVVASTVVPTDGVITLVAGATGTLEVSVTGSTAAGATFSGTGTITVPSGPAPLTATLSFSLDAPAAPTEATPPAA